MLYRMPLSSKNMRTTKDEPGIRPTPLHYLTGVLVLALVCCSLLCIYWYTTPARASSMSQQANEKTNAGQVPFDETETDTPSPTVTTTATATPTPSPSATRTTTPTPTSTRSPTRKQTSSPGATPTSSVTSISITTQGTGTNQTPVASPASTNNQGDQSSQGATQPGNTFPFAFLKIGLGSVVLLGVLFLSGWIIVRRRLLPVSSPKLPPSGAAPWSRTRISDQKDALIAQRAYDLAAPLGYTRISDQQEQAVQYGTQSQISPFSPQGHALYNTPSVALFAGTTTATPGLYISSVISQYGSLFTSGSNPPAGLNALPTQADVPIPNQPASSFGDHATPAAASPVSYTNPFPGIGQSFDSPYLEADYGIYHQVYDYRSP